MSTIGDNVKTFIDNDCINNMKSEICEPLPETISGEFLTAMNSFNQALFAQAGSVKTIDEFKTLDGGEAFLNSLGLDADGQQLAFNIWHYNNNPVAEEPAQEAVVPVKVEAEPAQVAEGEATPIEGAPVEAGATQAVPFVEDSKAKQITELKTSLNEIFSDQGLKPLNKSLMIASERANKCKTDDEICIDKNLATYKDQFELIFGQGLRTAIDGKSEDDQIKILTRFIEVVNKVRNAEIRGNKAYSLLPEEIRTAIEAIGNKERAETLLSGKLFEDKETKLKDSNEDKKESDFAFEFRFYTTGGSKMLYPYAGTDAATLLPGGGVFLGGQLKLTDKTSFRYGFDGSIIGLELDSVNASSGPDILGLASLALGVRHKFHEQFGIMFTVFGGYLYGPEYLSLGNNKGDRQIGNSGQVGARMSASWYMTGKKINLGVFGEVVVPIPHNPQKDDNYTPLGLLGIILGY